MSFVDKVVIITGAGSGIGAAIAINFAKLSAKLSLIDKNETTLKETAQKCEELSKTQHLTITADLSKLEDIEIVVPETIKRFGRIDILINNAGIPSQERIAHQDIAVNFEATMRVNLGAPIILTNRCTPYLIKTKGCIINMASYRSSRPSPLCPMYCVSKAGLEIFTKCLALDLADKGVRCNSIHPGVCRTNFTLGLTTAEMISKNFENLERKLPFGIVEPQEVANMVVFLCDNELARSITGGSYYIDGGVSLMETITCGGKF